MAGMSASAVEATRTTGWHRCAGCHCFIHTAVLCGEVCAGEAEGEYRCGHCHALARLYAPPPPPPGDDGCSPPDDEEQDLASADLDDDQKKSNKREAPECSQGQRIGKKQRCGTCKQFGHKKNTCKQTR